MFGHMSAEFNMLYALYDAWLIMHTVYAVLLHYVHLLNDL